MFVKSKNSKFFFQEWNDIFSCYYKSFIEISFNI